MTICYTIVDSEKGPVLAAESARGLAFVALGDGGLARLTEFSRRWYPGEQITPSVVDCAGRIMDYLEGRLREFDLPLDLNGTDFQREVWAALAHVPYGRTITYGELADRVGRPGAARAAGRACAANPVPLAAPCHRVVAANGGLGGYSAGLDWKKWLLALEGVRAG